MLTTPFPKTRTSLFVLAVSLAATRAPCQTPAILIGPIDGVSHSTARVNYQWKNGPLTSTTILYAVAPALCTNGASQPVTIPSYYSPWSVVIAGLTPATTYNVCVSLGNSNGATISPPTSFTTLTLPSVHPALPIAPSTFGSDYPDTSGYATVTTKPDCSDLQDDIDQALYDQASHGTTINIPAGSVCTSLPRITFSKIAADAKHFGTDAVTVGSPGLITIPNHQFIEGQLVTIGKVYAGSYPSSNSCESGSGLANGRKYYAHIVDPNTFALYCDDRQTLLSFFDQGSAPQGFLLVPHFSANGVCPTVTGQSPCTYWSRKLNWIIIRSSASDRDLPPEHTRINPAWCAAKCATIVNPVGNVNYNSTNHYFVTFGDLDGNANPMTGNIRLGPGIELTNAIDPNYGTYGNLINTGSYNSDIVFDRIYLHGQATPQRWGGASLPAFQWNGLNFVAKDSYIDNMINWGTTVHEGSSGILSAGPGPTMIVNNYFEGVGILVHFDGGGGTTNIAEDNTIIRNTFVCPLRYMYGSATSDGFMYGNRQPLEFKEGRRNLVGGNVFNWHWNEITGNSVFVALTSVGGPGIRDTELSNNTFNHGPGVANIPMIIAGGVPQTMPPNRFLFRNNIASDIGPKWWVPAGGAQSPNGWLFEGPQGSEDIIVDHNTITGNSGRIPSIFFLFDTNAEGLQVTNNIFQVQPGAGINVDGSIWHPCSGLTDAALWTCAMATDSTWADNLLIPNGSNISQLQTSFQGLASYYAPSYSGMTAAVATGAITGRTAYLQSQICEFCTSSTTQGKAVGVNLNDLLAAQGNVILVGATASGSSATINFVAPDPQGCAVDYSSTDPNVMTDFTRIADAGGSRVRAVSLVGLARKTNYYFRVNCASQQPLAKFATN